MALFEPPRSTESEEIVGSDAATRALSVTVVENDFVARVYENIAWGYDLVFGPTLHPGRVDAIKRMGIKPGDRVLEVGVGTGINVDLYPADCAVTGIDLSSSMLEKARERVARRGIRNVRLMQMDAANLKFADDTFDIVYAPYVISVVPDPVAVTRAMRRACRPGGRPPRDAPRLPPRRPHRHPESLPQPQPPHRPRRAHHLPGHRAHRLQIG